ncbi:MAG: peptidase T [Tenacibaculum sp.]
MNEQHILNRFVRYAKIDTQSNADNLTFPSTKKQWNLAKVLEKELKDIGMKEVRLDKNCYLTASLPSNTNKEVPTIGFIAHIDTSPDYTGFNVKPQVHPNYNGGDIVLNKQRNLVLSPDDFKDLLQYKGQTLITTDGTTLLGADNKAGIAEIVSAMEYLVNNPEIKHGKIRICFTPDEEIGRGAHRFDIKNFGADWAYTIDGSKIGELEYENFNAASAEVKINGRIVHPGYAKDKMINSMLIATDFISALPKDEVPENTSAYQGFFHLHSFKGKVEYTVLEYIIRDHDAKLFKKRKQTMLDLAIAINKKIGKNLIEVKIKDQYYNMREKIIPIMHIVDTVAEVMKDLNINPVVKPIRGGTDGAQLAYKGLPCPNIFAGGHNFHSPYEYLPLESMIKASKLIVCIAQRVVKKYAR